MIHIFNEDDYSKIINLGKNYDNNFASKYLSDNYQIYFYEKDNIIKGFLIVEITMDETGIVLLYVSPEFRKQGVGSELLKYLIENNINCSRLLLEVSNKNIPAINLYKKYGFTMINTRKKYYRDGSDALVMEKRLDNE